MLYSLFYIFSNIFISFQCSSFGTLLDLGWMGFVNWTDGICLHRKHFLEKVKLHVLGCCAESAWERSSNSWRWQACCPCTDYPRLLGWQAVRFHLLFVNIELLLDTLERKLLNPLLTLNNHDLWWRATYVYSFDFLLTLMTCCVWFFSEWVAIVQLPTWCSSFSFARTVAITPHSGVEKSSGCFRWPSKQFSFLLRSFWCFLSIM